MRNSRFFFIIQWPDGIDDDAEGTLLSGKEAAHAYAHRIIRELKEAGGYDDPAPVMIVRDTDGTTVYSIPFYSDALSRTV